MCLGNNQQPQAPQVVYRGPSDGDIQRNQASLATFSQQMQTQQDSFAASLQQQIDDANTQFDSLQSQFDKDVAGAATAADKASAAATAAGQGDLAAAAAQGLVDQANATAPGANQSNPADVEQVQKIEPKKKQKKGLKLQSNSVAASAGTGLNFGV